MDKVSSKDLKKRQRIVKFSRKYKTSLESIQDIAKDFSWENPFSRREDIFISICLATAQAICWGKEGLSLIELGVYDGNGLGFIIKVAEFLENAIGMKYHVYGFDSFEGLPDLAGYEDHHEIWTRGEYNTTTSYSDMVKEFEGTATLIKGDVKETVESFLTNYLNINYPIGFISLDLDLYSSSRDGLRILEDIDPNKYIPTIPMIVDDQDYLITYNDWCGEGKAIREFNDNNEFRKIQNRKEIYQRLRFIHVLDHNLRTGKEKPKEPLKINVRRFVKFNERSMI